MLPGLAPTVVAAVQLPTIAYVGQSAVASSATTYNFSQTVAASPDTKYLIIGFCGTSTASRSISSVTWNGITGVQLASIQAGGGNPSQTTALYLITVPPLVSDITANVVVTFSGTMVRCGYALWSARYLQSTTPQATATSTVNPNDLSLSAPGGSLVIGYSSNYTNAATRTYTWSGLVEDFDAEVQASQSSHTGARLQPSSTGAITITVTPSASTTQFAGVAVALR